jgi:cyclohexyl-isocyanide hydratase
MALEKFPETPMPDKIEIGFLLFPKVTQLDLTGPLQVLSRVPGASIHLVWKRIEPVPSDAVLRLLPTTTYADCPQLDVICVPGGSGADDMLNDDETLGFLRRQAPGARFVTAVCTGSLVLGAAGLLDGYRATTHWSAMQYLARFGAEPTPTRVCTDRNRITGGGVTAGIDFALTLAAVLADATTAQMIQLGLEYDPAPPFAAGSPAIAPPEVVARVTAAMAPSSERRRIAVEKAATRAALPT